MTQKIDRLALVLFVAASLFMTSCTKTAEKQKPNLGTVRIAYSTILNAGLVHIAISQGFFEAEGLTVQTIPFSFGKLCLDAVIDGKADISTVAETPVIFALLDDKNISISAVIETSEMTTAIVADKSKGISKPSDLVGKNIGVTRGTSGEYFLDSYLLAYNIKKSSMNIVDVPPEQMWKAIQDGSIAAAATWSPNILNLYGKLKENGIIFHEENLYTAFFCIATDTNWAKDNPEKMQAFMRALLRAEVFAKENQQEAHTAIATLLNVPAKEIETVWDQFNFKVNLDQSLLVALQDETRWALSLRSGSNQKGLNYLEHIYYAALDSVQSDRVKLIR